MLILLMIEDMLADFGCLVTAAATVDQALGLIDTHTFDAAMLDMNLGGRNTHAVADQLVSRGLPFIFSTGYSGSNIGVNYPNQLVLRKPFKDEELAEMLTSALS